MKRASYRDAIDYIACNDEPNGMDIEEIIGYTTVQLVSNIFGLDDQKVAKDIVKYREKHNIPNPIGSKV